MGRRVPLSSDGVAPLSAEDQAMLSVAMRRMSPADRDLARMLFSIERYGEPAAPEARFKRLPIEHVFLAFNLRDPRNRAVVAAALAQPVEEAPARAAE